MDIIATIATSTFVTGFVNVGVVFWFKERLRQSIKHGYDQDLERLIKHLEFDLDKKKRLYDGKLSQYKRYYSMMDAYSAQSRGSLFASFQDGILKFLQNPTEENLNKYIESMFAILSDISNQFLTFKNEIGGFRLEAGGALLLLIDKYVVVLEQTQDKIGQLIQLMNSCPAQFLASSIEANNPIQGDMIEELSGLDKELVAIQVEIFKEMRRELGIV